MEAENTIANREKFDAELESVHSTGVARLSGGRRPDNGHGQVIDSLSLSGPSDLFKGTEYKEYMIDRPPTSVNEVERTVARI